MAQRISDFTTLLETISFLPDTKHISTVAISGFGGSGKTTLADILAQNLPTATIVSADDFMLNTYHSRSDSWDCIDRPRIIAEVLQPAEKGADISFHVYDWDTNTAEAIKSIGNPGLLLLEGIGIIHPDLLPYFDFAVWLDEDLQTAGERGMKRDKELMHTDNDKLWVEVWMPNDQDYFNKYYPNQHVDYIYKDTSESKK